MAALWPWLALVGLGMFHGLNPAMGCLFAVALGMHHHSRETVLLSWVPIGLGHAVSIALVAAAFLILGAAIDVRAIRIGTGLVLMVWPIIGSTAIDIGSGSG
jgi:hypothetical protein